VALIPKKDGAESVSDYRPISLIHTFAKIISKVLAMRLAPHMNSLISRSQSAFIKKRSIHDNFMSVRCAVHRFYRSKTPSLFFKLDITKAFDSVRWEYLLTVMTKLGFPPKWREWMAALLSTSSSRILLNGVPTAHINHGRGLRQGDPLSPLLFVIAINPLQKILDLAIEEGHLAKFMGKQTVMRTSIYVDDTAIFVKPYKKDVTALVDILAKFGEVSGLQTNVLKSSVIPIRCQGVDLDEVLRDFPARRAYFPTKYLRLPLTNTRLRRVDF
jgi:hypothetical protein